MSLRLFAVTIKKTMMVIAESESEAEEEAERNESDELCDESLAQLVTRVEDIPFECAESAYVPYGDNPDESSDIQQIILALLAGEEIHWI